MPQSSHSRTGFHPSRFAHTSHLALRSVLEKNSSSGFHSVSLAGSSFAAAPRFVPGLMSVKRCTIGTMVEPARIVDPPSVAAATDGANTLDVAVWYDSIESIDSVVVGVGACAPVASGRDVRSSDPLGFGDGRIVMMDESEGGTVSVDMGECPRITVVL